MGRQPWATGRFDFPYLRVPTLGHAPLREEDDIIYCLWMVANYMENEYSDEEVRLRTNAPTIDEIAGHISTDELGWTPNQSDLTTLSIMTSQAFHFSLDSWGTTPPRQLVEIAEDGLRVDLPMIAYVDDLQMRRQIRGDGPMHAVVIVGTDNSSTAIADPWTGSIREVDRDKLDDAWDPSHHQIIEVELAPSLGATDGEDK